MRITFPDAITTFDHTEADVLVELIAELTGTESRWPSYEYLVEKDATDLRGLRILAQELINFHWIVFPNLRYRIRLGLRELGRDYVKVQIPLC